MAVMREEPNDFYVLFGGGPDRDWEEARKYGFISAAGSLHLKKLSRLEVGTRVWVYLPKRGYVGVGNVSAPVIPLRDFSVQTDDGASKRLVELPTAAARLTTAKWEPRRTEHVVAISWKKTVPASEAVHDKAFFTNQNVTCSPDSPRWERTLEALRRAFGVE